MCDVIENFKRQYQLDKKSEDTVNTYTMQINMFFKWLLKSDNLDRLTMKDINGVSKRTIEEYKSHCIDNGNANSSTNLKIISVSKLYDFLVDEELISKNPCINVKSLPNRYREKDFLSIQESMELLDMVDGGHHLYKNCNRLRDVLLFKIFIYAGLRLSENAGLKEYEYLTKEERKESSYMDIENNELRILGKGGKERRVGMNEEIMKSYNEYKKYKIANGIMNKHLYVTTKGKPVTNSAIQKKIQDYYKMCGWEDRDLSCHSLRHSFGSMMASEVSSLQLQKLMGHSDIKTTSIYCKLNAESRVILASKNPLLQAVNNKQNNQID